MYTNTYRAHSKTAGIGGVRVSADEEATGESIILEQNLVNDTRARFPETNVVLGARGGEEVVHLFVDLDSSGEILRTTDLGLNQVVAMYGGRIGDRGHASRHELENGHLRRGILTGHTVRTELEVRRTTFDLLTVGVVQMGVEDLLGEGKRAIESLADNC